MFTYSNIYYYRYNPKGLGKLPVFDQFPLMLPLDVRGATCLGINLHWIKKAHQQEFLEEVDKILLKSKGKKEKFK